jgi:3-oxoacyl-[acyl-carrier-protein] synthase III
MEGKDVFKFAVKALPLSVKAVLDKAKLTASDISLLIPHQANVRIVDFALKILGLPKENVYVNLQRYGNTSAASIPIALDEAIKEKRINKGDIIVLAGFGAGLTYGANIIKW